VQNRKQNNEKCKAAERKILILALQLSNNENEAMIEGRNNYAIGQ